jgi:DNA-binding MarR family transcriptional regulator
MQTTTEENAISIQPKGRVASGTHPLESQRLALLETIAAGCDPLHAQAINWLVRAYTAVTAAHADGLRPLGLSPSGFYVLVALLTTPERQLEPRQIADRLQLSRPSVTGLLDTLQDRGFVVRRPHRDDRRRVLVEPTQRAERVLEEYLPEHCKSEARILEALDGDEIETLVLLLRKIRGAVPPEYSD